MNAGKGIDGFLVGVAARGIVLDGVVDEFGVGEVLVQAFDAVVPELGFDAAEAALDPLGGDEGVDERELRWAGGPIVEEVRGGEGFKFGGDDVGPGVNAGFEGVEAIGVDLGLGGHGFVLVNS